MKYSILGFNQEQLIKQEVDCDLIDLALLNYIIHAQASPKMKHVLDKNETPHVWLHHEHILEDLPVLRISKGTLKNRISELRRKGYITAINIASEKGKGSKTYYATTSLIYDLVFDTTSRKNDPITVPGHEKMTPNTQVTNNNKSRLFISKDINNSQKPAEQEVQSFVDLYHEICTDFPKVKKITTKRKKAILNIISNYKYGDIKTVMYNLQNSDFCKGNNSRGWKADIDFILREDKFISTLEGKYDNHKNNGPNKFGEFEGMSTDGYTEEELEAMRKGQPNGKRTHF